MFCSVIVVLKNSVSLRVYQKRVPMNCSSLAGLIFSIHKLINIKQLFSQQYVPTECLPMCFYETDADAARKTV